MSDQANDSLEELFLFGEEKMEKAITQLKREFGQIRSGRANPLILDKVVVDYYGAPTPLRQLSQVNVQEGTTLVITPYDKSILKEIEKAIIKAEIGITPNSDGICIRLAFPPLTEERRKEIVKDVKKIGEEAKVAVRNIRRDMTDSLKKIEKDEKLPEDTVKDNQDKIQKLTDKYTGIIDSNVSEKEKEVLTV
ncbi:TPA: ribosome recycling factor [Candidatus Scatousia excrementigallinarum]|uniref:Ribosome-recycling factor n=1 Tax=Candidatus Scatousia excrementigallinarum TaxID=2840935 RepID=A0A9D1EXQ5_9BACT|nr:ribosome recycling factor [Candidatus Scatousia excrementigallinarum]